MSRVSAEAMTALISRLPPPGMARWRLHPEVDPDRALTALATAEIRAILADVQRMASVDPALVAAELRPVVAGLVVRQRRCDGCGGPYIQKRRHRRGRGFCGDACRVRQSRRSA